MSTSRGNCDSGLHHESSIEGDVLHYMGCIRFEDRPAFLASLGETDRLRLRIVEEEARITKLRKAFKAEGLRAHCGKLLARFKTTRSHLFPSRGRARSEVPTQASPFQTQSPRQGPAEDNIDLDDQNANMIFFKGNRPYDHPQFPDEKFPNQKIPLSQLLKDDKTNNPLMWECERDMVRYFHLPANNMVWVEVRPFA